jgi:hypothetical protein
MTTYYVDGAVGSDANAGTSEGAGNAWATIQKALDTVAAGDVVNIKASATYSESLNIVTAGGTTNEIVLEGYTATVGDDGRATISGGTNNLTSTPTGSIGYVFKNLRFTAATSHAISMGTKDYMTFLNCSIDNSGGRGAIVDQGCYFISCDVFNNATDGLYLNNYSCVAVGCKIYGNGNKAIDGNDTDAVNCLIFNNGATFDAVLATNCYHCTIDGDGTTGNAITTQISSAQRVVNCILHDCDYGVSKSSASYYNGHCIVGNLVTSMTGKYENCPGSAIGYGDSDETTTPGFVDEAGDDYTLTEDSAARGAGLGVDP